MQKKLDIKGMTDTVLRGGDAQALLSVPDEAVALRRGQRHRIAGSCGDQIL